MATESVESTRRAGLTGRGTIRVKYTIGIDLGGTNIAVGLVDGTGRILEKRTMPTDAARGADDMICRMAARAREVAAACAVPLSAVSGVGVGVPGACDTVTGVVRLAVNLGWRDVSLAGALGAHLGLPVALGNDADAAALGEVTAGVAAGCGNALMVTIGTGIGGGLVIDRKIFTGCGGVGTEPGHIMLAMDGEICGCGKRGCFEAYASATALIRQTKQAMQAHPGSTMWQFAGGASDGADGCTAFECAKAGDAAANQVVTQYISYLAAGIGSLINVFRPELVILGGGISNQGAYLTDRLDHCLWQYCYGGQQFPPPPVVCAVLGNDAGIIGAALLAQE